jgi:hypothetical protein
MDLIKNLHKEYKRQNPVLAHHTTPFQNSDPMSQSTARVDLKRKRSDCELLQVAQQQTKH